MSFPKIKQLSTRNSDTTGSIIISNYVTAFSIEQFLDILVCPTELTHSDVYVIVINIILVVNGDQVYRMYANLLLEFVREGLSCQSFLIFI